MRMPASLVLTAIALSSGCGDPDRAERSSPPGFASSPTAATTSSDDTARPGATDAARAVAASTSAPTPGTTSGWFGTEPPQSAIVTTAPPGETVSPSVPPGDTAAPICMGASMQWAPPLPSDEWQQFVLEAAPTGACGVSTVLMMSLVIPGTADAPGTLVTIVAQPTELAMAQSGTPIEIDGRPATLQESVSADGRPATTIIAQFGDVVIDAHGSVDEPTLRRIVASIRQVDDAAWAELVASIDRG